MFFVACCSVVAFASWRGLHKAPERPSVVTLLFLMFVMAMLAKSLVNFTCFRERLVFGLVIIGLVIGEAERFLPSAFGQHAETVKSGHLALSLLALLVSLTMLVQSARTPKVEPNEIHAPIARQLRRNALILLAVVATILVLGSLLYFLPFQQH